MTKFNIGDKGTYVNNNGLILLRSEGSTIVEVSNDTFTIKTPSGDRRTFTSEGKGTGWSPRFGSYNSDLNSRFIVTEKATPMFNFKPGMVFPTENPDYFAHIDKVSEDGKYAFGHTSEQGGHHEKSDHTNSKAATVWTNDGKMYYRASHLAHEKRDLRMPKSDAQIQYEKLDTDGRGILAALQSNYPATINYLKDKLKVDVNLAEEISSYANTREYK